MKKIYYLLYKVQAKDSFTGNTFYAIKEYELNASNKKNAIKEAKEMKEIPGYEGDFFKFRVVEEVLKPIEF